MKTRSPHLSSHHAHNVGYLGTRRSSGGVPSGRFRDLNLHDLVEKKLGGGIEREQAEDGKHHFGAKRSRTDGFRVEPVAQVEKAIEEQSDDNPERHQLDQL